MKFPLHSDAIRSLTLSPVKALGLPLLAVLTPLVQGYQEQEGAEPTEVEAVPAAEITDEPELIKLIELSRELDGAQRHIEVITGHFPHRLTGCSQLKLAQDWARTTFEDWGLEARLETWGDVPVGFDRGPSQGRVVSGEGRALNFITPCWSPGTLGAVQGPAIQEPATLEELEERQDEFAGAWVLRNPKVGRADRRDYEELFEEIGIAGTVQAGSRDGRLTMRGSWDIEWDDLPSMVKVTVLFDEFKQLVDELKAAEDGGGEPVRLEFNIENQFLHGPIPQYNVVAEIPGSEWPDEFVIVQGHIDAWDGAQGACDNGTGVATTLEAARLIKLAEIQPRRTIRFVLYSGEEQGLYGSRAYVDLHVDELEKISIVLNHDNGTNYLRGIGATAAMLEDFERVFAPVMKLDPSRPFEVREVSGLRPGPSDHSPFISAGVPGFHWSQSSEGYRRLHHTQHDTLAEVNPQDQAHSSLVIALAAVGFANLDHRIDRSLMREPEPRRMGVYLEGRLLERVVPDSRAAKAGWQVGDEIVSVDGVEVKSRRDILRALQAGDPQMVIIIKRGDETLETELDYSDDPMEKERGAWRTREAEAEAAKAEAAKTEAAKTDAAKTEEAESTDS